MRCLDNAEIEDFLGNVFIATIVTMVTMVSIIVTMVSVVTIVTVVATVTKPTQRYDKELTIPKSKNDHRCRYKITRSAPLLCQPASAWALKTKVSEACCKLVLVLTLFNMRCDYTMLP